jgi:hypothetical protein
MIAEAQSQDCFLTSTAEFEHGILKKTWTAGQVGCGKPAGSGRAMTHARCGPPVPDSPPAAPVLFRAILLAKPWQQNERTKFTHAESEKKFLAEMLLTL